jgi:N utilization substance protein A
LNDEKIDVIEWNPDPAGYIAKALSPARVTGVYLNEHAKGNKTATVVVPEDQLSLAIGRDGQNARLAAKLTAWRIDIKSLPEAAADALHKLQTDPEYAALAEKESDLFSQIEAILNKKSEGRPVTPEEYAVLSQFVDRVERTIIGMRQAEYKVEKAIEDEARSSIPEAAFEMPIQELNLADRIQNILIEAGYLTTGDLFLQLQLDADAILRLNGIGPKAMETIRDNLTSIEFPEAEPSEPEGLPEAMVSDHYAEEVTDAGAAETEEVEVEQVTLEQAMESPAEEVEDASAVQPSEVETLTPPAHEPEIYQEPEAREVETEETAEEVPASLEEIFALKPEAFDVELAEVDVDEDEEDEDASGRKKKKKKKKKFVEMEYDPEKDVMIVKRVRKRDDADWEDNWNI